MSHYRHIQNISLSQYIGVFVILFISFGILTESIVLDLSRSHAATSTLCDSYIRTSVFGNWSLRWGSYAISMNEPPVHACASDGKAGILTSSAANAALLYSKQAKVGSVLRNARVSFMVPNFSQWGHVSAFAAFNQQNLGRMGAIAYKDKLFIQFNATNEVGCSGTQNQFPVEGVVIPGGLQAGRWYRLDSSIQARDDGSLAFRGTLRDLQQGSGVIIQTVTATIPRSCIPGWYYSAVENRWAAGFVGYAQGLAMRVDDFYGYAR